MKWWIPPIWPQKTYVTRLVLLRRINIRRDPGMLCNLYLKVLWMYLLWLFSMAYRNTGKTLDFDNRSYLRWVFIISVCYPLSSDHDDLGRRCCIWVGNMLKMNWGLCNMLKIIWGLCNRIWSPYSMVQCNTMLHIAHQWKDVKYILKLMKNTPYLTVCGELWHAYWKCFEDNWSRCI